MVEKSKRVSVIHNVLSYLDDGEFESELARRVRYKTESQVPDSLAELHRYLDDEMIPAFSGLGFRCEKFENPHPGGGPFLLASRLEGDNLPTVLGYGHGDVVNGQYGRWSANRDPWELSLDGDKLYGRGTADNKGQHTINMAALKAVIQTRGKLGFNAKYLIEMGEEVGSPGLHDVVEANKEKFAADVFIGSDGPRMSPSVPTITLGSRGALNFNLQVNLREGAHHSGNWGGLIADPAIILSHAIASITDANGRIKISDWRPPPMPESVQRALVGLEIEGGPGAPEIDPFWGEPGLSPASKVYAGNSFAVLAMKSGDLDKPVNAIAPWAAAQCQLRFFAGTPQEKILPALRDHLDAHGFSQVEVSLPEGQAGFPASRTEPNHPWVRKVLASVKGSGLGQPAVIPSMGGSICNDVFTDLLGLPAIWIPHSYAGCSQHAPDEHILLSVTRSALVAMAGLYWDIGES